MLRCDSLRTADARHVLAEPEAIAEMRKMLEREAVRIIVGAD